MQRRDKFPIPRFAVVLLLLVLPFALTACEEEEPTAVERAEEANIEPLVLGDEATITGEVSERLTPFAFRVGETLVVAADAGVVGLFDDFDETEEVVVTGTIRQFFIADAEEEFGDEGFQFDEEIFQEFERELFLVASNVRSVEEDIEEPEEEEEQVEIGQTTTITGEITEILSPNLFRVDDQLVLAPQPAAPDFTLEESRNVAVTGTAREFIIVELEEEFGIDLDDEEFAELEAQEEIVIVADVLKNVP